jgi:hypothetical protein
MAKSLLSMKGKKKKTRVTKNEAYLVNFKYMGDEPEFKAPLSNTDYSRALNWYNAMATMSEAREYIVDYLKANDRRDDVKKFNRVPDTWVSTTVAWVCRMLSRGYLMPGNPIGYVTRELDNMLTKAKEVDDAPKDTAKVSIQDRMREKVMDIIGEVEAVIDSGEEFSMYDWLKTNETPPYAVGYIVSYYAGWLQELIEAYEGPKDAQLVEAYAYMTRKQLKERITFMHKLIEDAEKYAGVAKKTRAPRKPRPVSKEKLLKNFKYQKESNEYKIASINPDKIIGAQELWCFNTKYKTVTVFRALDRGGLKVKGSAITGYDEKTSMTKGVGRKPEPVIDKLQNGGKIVLKKLMEELKTSKALQYRINENTILMKVVM